MKRRKSSFGKAFLSKRRFALVEIAVVLCSVFLVALPAIAADQTTQKASTNAITITAASENLALPGQQVYGDANEDDVIDMRDVTYIKLVIFGKKPKTDLADANNDGKVSMLDVGQTKLIILGKEKKLTIIDAAERIVTFDMPVESIAVMYGSFAEVVVAIDAVDKVSAVDTGIAKKPYLYPELAEKPVVGTHGAINYELMFEIRPQLVITYPGAISVEAEEKLKPAGIQLVFLTCGRRPLTVCRGINMMGLIMDKQQETAKFLDFIHEYVGTVEERLSKLDEDEKKRVFWETSDYKTCGRGSGWHEFLVMSGAKNIFDDIELVKGTFEVSKEEVLNSNPQVVLRKSSWDTDVGGYFCSDTSNMAALRDELMGRPGWDELDAVKNEQVYIIYGDFMQRPRSLVGVCYFAKCLYPDLFQDIDVTAFHKEWLEEFYGLEYKGVYAYPIDCCPGLNVA